MPFVTLMRGTSGVWRCEMAILRPGAVVVVVVDEDNEDALLVLLLWLVRTRRWNLGGGDLDLECGRCASAVGLLERLVTLCGRIGRGRVMVVSSGEDVMETMDELRRRMVAAGEVTEDRRRGKDDALRGKKGIFGVDGVVGVSIGDGCWSCISGRPRLSLFPQDEYSSVVDRVTILNGSRTDSPGEQKRLEDYGMGVRLGRVRNVLLPSLKEER